MGVKLKLARSGKVWLGGASVSGKTMAAGIEGACPVPAGAVVRAGFSALNFGNREKIKKSQGRYCLIFAEILVGWVVS